MIISRKGKSASGVEITTEGDPTVTQPLTPRTAAARITGYERPLEGENKDTGGNEEEGNNSDDTVDMEMDPLVEEGKEKRGRGRPPTTGEHVGKREEEEEKGRRKEKELDERAKMALSRNPPTGRQWEKAKVWEMEMEEELSKAPTMDIAAQMMEQSAIMFKTAPTK